MEHTDIGAAAAKATEAELAPQIAELTTLTQDQITDLFPEQNDQDCLAALISVIRDSANDNERTAKLVDGIGNLGSIVVKVLMKSALKVG